MVPFAPIRDRAVARHGEDGLAARLPVVRTPDELRAVGDDRYLSAMTARVFAAGFQWKVIEAKWPGFEAAFEGFAPSRVAAFDDDAVDGLLHDDRIVRNRAKILATVANAAFVRRVAVEHGSFGAWLAAWPSSDTVGLWWALAEGGDRLGGDTGPWFLRQVGKDTFRLSADVVQALIEAGVVTKAPTSQRDLVAVQAAFTAWSEETGLGMGALSVTLACATGEVRARH